MKRTYARWAITVLGIAGGMLGCGDRYFDYCERKMVCEGGNDKDLEACQLQAEHEENVADIYGCEDQWDSYSDCFIGAPVCGELEGQGCEDERDAWRRCVR